ncbi:MAG: type IV pilus assembly protein PilM [bacterium]
MAKVIAGLEVGMRAVKAVELIHSKNGYQLRKLARLEIPFEVSDHTKREEIIVKLIKDLISKYRINTRRVVSGVGGESVIVRRITLPPMKEKEIAKAVRWQAEDYIPYSMDQVCLGFDVLDRGFSGKKEEEIPVILVGVKREAIERHLRLLRQARISPQALDVNTLALFNVFQLSNPNETDGIALLEVGHRSTSIVLLDKGSPFLIRDVNLAGFHITETMAEEMGTSFMRAEEIKQGYGFMASDESEREVYSNDGLKEATTKEGVDKRLVDHIIRRSMEALVEEVIHSFEYYSSQREGKPIKKVVLSGGTSQLPNIDKFLSEELGLPVKIISPFAKITCEVKKFPRDYLARVGPMFTVALGFALQEVRQI